MKKHTPRFAALGALVCLAGGTAHAQTGNAYYQVINETLSGGGTDFMVASDVTFTNLSLTEVFSSGRRLKVSLPQSSVGLDTGIIELDSSFFTNPDPTYGTVTLATLNGLFDNGIGTASYRIGDTEAFDIINTFGGPTTSATVFADFTASLVNPDFTKPVNTVNIFAFDANTPGTTYAAGTFSLLTNITAAPEPSPVVLLALGALGVGSLCVVARRRSASSDVPITDEGEITCA